MYVQHIELQLLKRYFSVFFGGLRFLGELVKCSVQACLGEYQRRIRCQAKEQKSALFIAN